MLSTATDIKTPVPKRVWRVLPPVGGTIPLRVVFDALLGSVTAKEPARPTLAELLVKRTDVPHWIFTNSGRSAISVVLMTLKELHPDRDEVVIPAYTSYSVAAAVVRAGLRVQLCDVELATLGMCPKALERLFTPKTLCVIPHHLYGVPCQIKAICEIAREYGIPIVEDAAQAMGCSYMEAPLGSFGEANIFSLSRGKSLPAAGGGLIGTRDEMFTEGCRRILRRAGAPRETARNVGVGSAIEAALRGMFMRPSLYWVPASLPFLGLGQSTYDPNFEIRPMSKFQEQLAARLLPALDRLVAIRQRNAARLRRALGDVPGLSIISPAIDQEKNVCLRLPILVEDSVRRNQLLEELERQGLGATCGYPSPLSDLSELRSKLTGSAVQFPVARQISQQLITLPTHPDVTECDMDRMVEVLRRCIQTRL